MGINRRKRFAVFQRDNFACRYCGARVPDVVLEVDHKIPRIAGGSDDMDNLVSACWDCNRGKAAMLLRPPEPDAELVKTVRCKNGPLKDQEFEVRGQWPILWVREMANGSIVATTDRWIFRDYSECDPVLERGHPAIEEMAPDFTTETGKTLGYYRVLGRNGYDAGEFHFFNVENLLAELAPGDWRGRP